MSKLNDLLVQRGRLLERIEAQREALVYEVQPVQAALDATDRVLATVRQGVAYIKGHPGITALAVAVLFALRGRRILRFAKRGFFLWRTWRALREKLQFSGFGFPL
ncbi:MAG: YqjK-like family protein [Betaproteobacteria bacterium]